MTPVIGRPTIPVGYWSEVIGYIVPRFAYGARPREVMITDWHLLKMPHGELIDRIHLLIKSTLQFSNLDL